MALSIWLATDSSMTRVASPLDCCSSTCPAVSVMDLMMRCGFLTPLLAITETALVSCMTFTVYP